LHFLSNTPSSQRIKIKIGQNSRAIGLPQTGARRAICQPVFTNTVPQAAWLRKHWKGCLFMENCLMMALQDQDESRLTDKIRELSGDGFRQARIDNRNP
jgi:hypothetical protein